MTLKEQAQKFIEEVRAGKIGEAMGTAADILKASAGFYKLVFGGAVATVTPEDLDGLEPELSRLYDEVATTPKAAGGQQVAVDPTLVLMLIDMVLKIIAERRKQK